MKERNIEYENKFKKYLYSFDFEIYKQICEKIEVKPKELGGR